MAITITDEELDLFNKNGFTDDDVRATVENYRSQGLDDNAIRAKVQSKIDSWNAHQNVKQPINNAQGEVEEVSTQPNLKLTGEVKKYNESANPVRNAIRQIGRNTARFILPKKAENWFLGSKEDEEFLKKYNDDNVMSYEDAATLYKQGLLSKDEFMKNTGLRLKLDSLKADAEYRDVRNTNIGKGVVDIGTAAIPFGGGGKVATTVAGKLTPYLGRKIATETAKGAVIGGKAGLAHGVGYGLVDEDINPLTQGLVEGGIGTVGGGLLGVGAGKLERTLRAKDIAKRRTTPLADRMTEVKPQVSQEVVEQPIQQVDDVIEETVPTQQVDEVVESVPQDKYIGKKFFYGDKEDEIVEYLPQLDMYRGKNPDGLNWGATLYKKEDLDKYYLPEGYDFQKVKAEKDLINQQKLEKQIAKENLEKQRIEEYNNIDDFGSELSDMQLGKIRKTLNKQEIYNGELKTNKQAIKDLLEENATPDIREYNGKKEYIMRYPNGSYITINKTKYDYAKHLQNRPQQLDEVIPKQVVEDTAKTKERGFVDTIRQNYGDDVAKQIGDKEYDVYSHEMQKANWESRTPEQKLQALSEVDNINPDVLYGKAQALNQAIQNGEPLNIAMLDGIAKNLTKAGQEIEAAKHFIPTSPEGIVLETIKQTRKNTPKQVLKLKDETSQIVDEVTKTLPKQKTREQQLKAIERILSKRTAKPREQKSLATQLLALNDNNGLTPENFVRLVDKHYGIQTIDVSDYAKIQELSERFINAKTNRERDVANGLIKKFIWNKQPKKWADKDRTFRNMNMLLSLPSRLLDVTSTAAFQGINALDELVAKGIDKAMRTGLRGKMSTPIEWWKSVARGAKEGAEDVGLGINTARSGEVDRYELGFHPQFENVPILGGAEKALNATIRIPDRMFYESRFDSALKDLMSTGKFTAEEAEEIARNEALQAVFQGEGLLSKSSKFVRDLLNGRIDNKPMLDNETIQNIADNIQLGNRIAPFVQTPANLIAEGLERSPLGLAKGGFEMATAKTPQQLRQAQQTLAKGITGTTGATLGGGYLLNQVPNTIGGFTNEDLYGDDVTGLPPQSIVIGDKAVSLASIPFLTIPAGLGKALLTPDKTMPERLLNATTYTGNILSDLPMLKGLGDLYKGSADIAKVGADYALGNADLAEVEQSVGRVAGQQGANILSQYIPLSGTLGTIRNATDPYNREMMTYNENPLLGTAEYIGNRLQNRIPFASSLLPKKYNVLGEPSMRNNIENPIARTLEATISPVRIRNYTERPAEMDEMQRIQDYAMENNIKGKTTLKFAKPKRYIGRGKDKARLTNEQYSELTRLYNGKVYDELQFLMNTPEYQSADEETQIKWVREVMKEKKQEAEQEISDIIK